jgi:hypothetical protein
MDRSMSQNNSRDKIKFNLKINQLPKADKSFSLAPLMMSGKLSN